MESEEKEKKKKITISLEAWMKWTVTKYLKSDYSGGYDDILLAYMIGMVAFFYQNNSSVDEALYELKRFHNDTRKLLKYKWKDIVDSNI